LLTFVTIVVQLGHSCHVIDIERGQVLDIYSVLWIWMAWYSCRSYTNCYTGHVS